MAVIAAQYAAAVNTGWSGELRKNYVFQYGPNSYGKGTFELNVDSELTEIVSPQNGPVVYDRFFAGTRLSMTGTFQEISEAMLAALSPEIFKDETLGNMLIQSECGLHRDRALPLKIYEVEGCGQGDYLQHIKADPWLSFYLAVGVLSGTFLGNVRTDLRSVPFTFHFYANTQDVSGTTRDVFGYQGDAVALGVTPIP
jgi:hypothetical protein